MSVNTFFQKLVPKDKKFFPLFESAAENILQAAVLLQKVFITEDRDQKEMLFREIKDLEVRGDDIAHHIFDEMDKTFVTPFDREDIHKLTSSLDNVLDFINGSSQRLRLYKPKSISDEFSLFPVIILNGCKEIKKAIFELRNMKKPQKINAACVKINELENQADDLYHQLISDLFENEKDAIELIKKKEVLQTMERATDRIEDVADSLKTILIKMA